MREIKQVLAWNMVAIACYGVIYAVLLSWNGNEQHLGVAILMMFTVALHVAACLVASIVFYILRKNEYGSAFLLATLVVGLVGFSVCFGGAMTLG